ncbi:hypothetical protein CONPUDRAFT_39787, partial [Coniophora puteana RWD-64-598 SS2]
MLLDVIDNLPRLRISGAQLRLILWVLEECNVQNVPSFDSFRQLQKSLRKRCGSEPTAQTSVLGNHFYVNDIRDTIQRELANPLVASHMEFYPEDVGNGPVSEVWQAARWKEFRPEELMPMYSANGKQFYLGEVACLVSSRLVIPQIWIKRNRQLYADCYSVDATPEVRLHIKMSETISVPASEFQLNYLDLAAAYQSHLPWTSKSSYSDAGQEMPSKLRTLAGEDDLYVVMVPLWCDDVSGNRSKQYNKHINIYTVNSNLPGRLLQQEYFVRFVSTSPHATSPEQFSAVMDQINSTHSTPIKCYNASTKRPCQIVLRVPYLPADNPQQSEESSHMGPNANLKCRKCKKGGPATTVESDEGYHSLYFPGEARTAEYTRSTLVRQLSLAMFGVEKAVKELQTATGVKDKIAQHWIDILLKKSRQIQAESRIPAAEAADQLYDWIMTQKGDLMNPLLKLPGLDPCQDTPIEILHTILLGTAKYTWHFLHKDWKEDQQNLFVLRLQSTDISGLNVPPIRAAYMMQYKNGLIGKHFKTLMQCMIFHAHDLASPAQFSLIKSLGFLGALLWIPEIDNLEEYLSDLDIVVANFLDAFSDLEPSKITQKMKLQILCHLGEDIRRFGPAVRYSTEIFECFNAIFRLCSVLSNHLAPSRDIAMKFASMERMKHVLSGGYWLEDNQWVQASTNVRNLLLLHPIFQRHLGWAPERISVPGTQVSLAPAKKVPALAWSKTKASTSLIDQIAIPPSIRQWKVGISVSSRSGDVCKIGYWVFASGPQCVTGRIVEIIQSASALSDQLSFTTIDCFTLGDHLHPQYAMPVLHRASGAPEQKTVASKDVLCIFSAQHDCIDGKCKPGEGSRRQMQERIETDKVIRTIDHTNDSRFVINMHALHNAGIIRKLLPRHCVKPTLLYPDRKSHHVAVAAKLRKSQDAK